MWQNPSRLTAQLPLCGMTICGLSGLAGAVPGAAGDKAGLCWLKEWSGIMIEKLHHSTESGAFFQPF
jgi:hypothetical protein